MFKELLTKIAVVAVVSATCALTVIGGDAIAGGPISVARAQSAYSAQIHHVAGGDNLDEVQLFEDNYTRCYIIKNGSHCFAK